MRVHHLILNTRNYYKQDWTEEKKNEAKISDLNTKLGEKCVCVRERERERKR